MIVTYGARFEPTAPLYNIVTLYDDRPGPFTKVLPNGGLIPKHVCDTLRIILCGPTHMRIICFFSIARIEIGLHQIKCSQIE